MSESALASAPQQLALRGVLSDLEAKGALVGAYVGDLPDLLVQPRREAIKLDDEHGLGIERVARVNGFLDRPDDRAVHHLQRRGDHAGGDDPADGLGSLDDGVENREHRDDALGQR
jgi:hypothetical protein